MSRGLALVLGLLPAPALAHAEGGGADPLVMAVLVLAAVVYGAGLLRLWRRAGAGRGLPPARAAAFALGLGLTALLLSPQMEARAERLLTVHMVQHFGLMLVAMPLIVAGQPGHTLLRGLPEALRPAALGAGRGPLGAAWRAVLHPVRAAAVYFVALWLWHLPALHQAALASAALHGLQHASFILAALAFWSAILAPARGEGRAVALLAVFVTAVHSCALAALLTTSGALWYPAYRGTPALPPMADQQLAGLVMWVPCSAVLIGAALLVLRALLADSARRAGEAPR